MTEPSLDTNMTSPKNKIQARMREYHFQRSTKIANLKAKNEALASEVNQLREQNAALIQEKTALMELLRRELGLKVFTGQVIVATLESMSH